MSSEVKFENHDRNKQDLTNDQKVKLTDLLARLNLEKKKREIVI